jgi:O-antigen ligase
MTFIDPSRTATAPADHAEPSTVFPWISGALMAGVLVVPGAYSLLTLWLALYGLWHVRGISARVWQPLRAVGGRPIVWGMSTFTVLGVCMILGHGDKASSYEAFVPMLLAPLMVNAIVVARPPAAMLWLGSAAGASLAGLVACYQTFYLQIGRAGGAMSNIIIFGDLSVALAMFAGFGSLFWLQATQQLSLRLILMGAAALGMLASLLSGTKGGWLSILMLLVIWAWLALAHAHWTRRLTLSLALVGAVVMVSLLLPAELVTGRIAEAFAGGYTWFSTGKVTDISVSIRLEKWYHAVGMIADRPWTGWGKDDAIQELGRRLSAAGVAGHWTQTENDLLQGGINHGVLGVFTRLSLYLGFIVGFLCIRRTFAGSPLTQGVATLGMMLSVLMLEFGLSIVVLGRNSFRHFLVTWSMLCLGYLILAYLDRQRASPNADRPAS